MSENEEEMPEDYKKILKQLRDTREMLEEPEWGN